MDLDKNQLRVTWFDSEHKLQAHPSYLKMAGHLQSQMTGKDWSLATGNANYFLNQLHNELNKIGASVDTTLGNNKYVKETIVTFPDEETLVSWVLTWS